MDKISKYQSGIIVLSVLAGLFLGQFSLAEQHASSLIVPLLMAMLFGLFLSLDLSKLRASLANAKFLLTNIAINFLWTPLFAYFLGSVFLTDNLAVWIGFVMLMVTPCTDWYLVFTGLAKGNVSLSTAVLPVNLILQVVLLPVYLMVFFGQTGTIALYPLAASIVLVLFVPFLLALTLNKIAKRNTGALARSVSFFAKSQVLFLALAVVAMFASAGKSLAENLDVMLILLMPILLFFAVTFLIALAISRLLNYSYRDKVSLVFTTMARNSPIALALAVAAFPDQPLIALSLVVGPLIELPVLAAAARILLRHKANA